jgi:hypothetical protein
MSETISELTRMDLEQLVIQLQEEFTAERERRARLTAKLSQIASYEKASANHLRKLAAEALEA